MTFHFLSLCSEPDELSARIVCSFAIGSIAYSCYLYAWLNLEAIQEDASSNVLQTQPFAFELSRSSDAACFHSWYFASLACLKTVPGLQRSHSVLTNAVLHLFSHHPQVSYRLCYHHALKLYCLI